MAYIILALSVCVLSVYGVYASYPRYYADEVEMVSEITSVRSNLIYAVVKAESGFNKNALSGKDAVGLMQLTEETALDMAKNNNIDYNRVNLFEPELNILLGSYYLKWLLGKYDNNIRNALAAYNAGPGRVDTWLKERNDKLNYYPETKVFVSRVLDYFKRYNRLYGDNERTDIK